MSDYFDDFPGQFQHQWVDEWLWSNFPRIAGVAGPEAVLIAPSPKHNEEYLKGILGIESQGCIFDSAYGYGREGRGPELDLLHSGSPFIIFSRTPLAATDEENQAIIIALSGCRDTRDLGRVVDILIAVVKSDNWSLLKRLQLPAQGREPPPWEMEILKSVEIKPNVFGVGVNFNYLLKKFGDMLRRRRRPT